MKLENIIQNLNLVADLVANLSTGTPKDLADRLGVTDRTIRMHINYPREYAKAAVNNWNVYCNGGWLKVNSTWDTNWSTNEDQQGIIAYYYDWNASIKKTSVALTYKGVGFTVSFDRDTKYEGDFLGKNNEWWRDWFYATNQNPTPFDEVKYGYTVRSLGSLKFTTPTYTLYY